MIFNFVLVEAGTLSGGSACGYPLLFVFLLGGAFLTAQRTVRHRGQCGRLQFRYLAPLLHLQTCYGACGIRKRKADCRF